MRRLKYLLFVLPLVALSAALWAAVASAQSFQSGGNVTVAAGQTLNSTLFAAGRSLNITGNVNGDVFCAGQNVTISGRVRGDVVCMAQNLTVSGQVSGDVRLAGQNVTLGGIVSGNATIGAQSFTQQSNSIVVGDVSLGGQDATLNGKVGRDVAGGLSTLTLAGPVGRNVMANVEHLRLESGAKIAGNVNYTSNGTVSRASGAQVGGTVTRHTPASKSAHHHTVVFGWLFALYVYLAFILMALIVALLVPGMFQRAFTITQGRLGKTFLVGLVGGFVIPILIGVLVITVIGIPLALLFGLLWAVALLLAGPFAAYLLGRRILRGHHNAVLVMLVGTAVLYLVYLLPFVGWLVWLVGSWFGLGALLLLVRGINKPYHDVGADTPPVSESPVPAK